MTRNEFDAQMQRLKLEYTRKSNNINRRKDEAARDKRMHLMALRTKHDREHRVEMDKLAELMRAKAALLTATRNATSLLWKSGLRRNACR